MNATRLKDAEDAYRNSKDLPSWLKYFSIYTWNKIGFARIRNRLKMHETTITQDLVFQMSVALTQHKWSLTMYESTEENTNGNDLEILILTPKGFIMLPCQAKIIYKNDKYSAIKHPIKIQDKPDSTEVEQIELLLDYAKKECGIPIYLFYNFCTDTKSLNQVKGKIDFDIEEYGCSIVPARYIHSCFHHKRINKKGVSDWIIPTFADLHPEMAMPLHRLIDIIPIIGKF